MTSVRTLAFGDLAEGPFCFVWGGEEAVCVLGTPAGPLLAVPVTVTDLADDAPITVSGEGIALEARPGHGALCQVTGSLSADGETRTVTATGITAMLPVPPLGELEAIRMVLAWFAEDDGVVYGAARPRGAKGQDKDAIHATVFSPGGALTIDDGRLSTTYLADGTPARMSLELWSDDEEHPHPVRAAGEALSSGAALQVGGAHLEVRPLACHRAGRNGLGAYAIVRGA